MSRPKATAKYKVYSRSITILKCFAPTKPHILTSSLISATIMLLVIEWFRNTLAFLLFQISQEMSMASDIMGFLEGVFLLTTSLHQSLTVLMDCQAFGITSCSPNQSFTSAQTRVVKRHLKRRWAAVAST